LYPKALLPPLRPVYLEYQSLNYSLIIALKYHILGIKDVDIGFWDSDGVYIEDIQEVDLRKV
jgi:hypothetical protein